VLQFNALPWSDILSSSAVWAIVFGHFGACWGYYTLFTGMPTYFKDVLDFDIEQVNLELSANSKVDIDLLRQFQTEKASVPSKSFCQFFCLYKHRKILPLGGKSTETLAVQLRNKTGTPRTVSPSIVLEKSSQFLEKTAEDFSQDTRQVIAT